MSKDNFEEKLAEIRRSYITTMAPKREEIEEYWEALTDKWDNETQKKLYMIIHGIAGSAETFGFPELTRQARAVIDHLKQQDPSMPDEQFVVKLQPEVSALLKMLESASKK